MAWELQFYPDVKKDVSSAKKWYKEQQPGLEKRFAAEVKLTLQKIQAAPLHCEIKYRVVRTAYLRIFPFGIHFFVNEADQTITITAITHQHREPMVYQDR